MAVALSIGETLPELPTQLDGEGFHTWLHLLSILLLVYLVRAANKPRP